MIEENILKNREISGDGGTPVVLPNAVIDERPL